MNAGTLVCYSSTSEGVTGCNTSNSNILGVVSTAPAFLGGSDKENDPDYVVVGLVGQVPLQVSDANGPINSGDPLTFSADQGVAVKATPEGNIVGYALKNHTSSGYATILASVNSSYQNPLPLLNASGDLYLDANAEITGTLTVKTVCSRLIDFDGL